MEVRMSFKNLFRFLLMISFMTNTAMANPQPSDDFMLVLREVEGLKKQEFGFKPTGPSSATLSDGTKITVNYAWFDLIGDMHVRFVVDGEASLKNIAAEEFLSFGLSPARAAEVAINNLKKRYGAPKAIPWQDGIMLVAGDSPDLDSSYFLDEAFWNNLLKAHPEGVIVGVPKRGGLIYAPVSNRHAVASLERGIRILYESSGNLRVSSALYLFRNGKWAVYKNP